MDETQLSLLERVRGDSPEAWEDMDRLYRPFIICWFHSQGIAPGDADDLTQEVMTTLFREVKSFAHSGQTGAFRSWLRRVCLHRVQGYRRSQKLRGIPVGGSNFQRQLAQVEDEDAMTASWDREHDYHILRHLFAQLSEELEEKTLRAFERVALNHVPPQQVADELGMTVGAVYIAKSRVMRKLRQRAAGLLDDSSL